MRYIRTKDGRILKVFCGNVPLSKEIDGLTYYGENTIDFETSCWISKDEIIKQADTIEELCDEFVGFNGKRHKVLLFGAIRTDKGLIYVAKMNDKGELELL